MALAQARVIRGAVATLGVSDRVSFLRRTYAHLGVALLGFTALTAGLMQTHASFDISVQMVSSRGSWFAVMMLFMVVGWAAQWLAQSPSSRARQYLGLALGVVSFAFIFQPLLWGAYGITGGGGDFQRLILAIFVGLTATVFVTKKDFSFMRGALMIGSFAALGIVVSSLIFGFQLGALYSGAMILLMAGYILFQTSTIMRSFPPQAHVAAALMLFSTIATLFWYVLRLLMDLNRR
jgi:uncharacterized protein